MINPFTASGARMTDSAPFSDILAPLGEPESSTD